MLTVLDARYKHGYSGRDHLLSDRPAWLSGRSFPSRKKLEEAVERIRKEDDEFVAPIWIDVRIGPDRIEITL